MPPDASPRDLSPKTQATSTDKSTPPAKQEAHPGKDEQRPRHEAEADLATAETTAELMLEKRSSPGRDVSSVERQLEAMRYKSLQKQVERTSGLASTELRIEQDEANTALQLKDESALPIEITSYKLPEIIDNADEQTPENAGLVELAITDSPDSLNNVQPLEERPAVTDEMRQLIEPTELVEIDIALEGSGEKPETREATDWLQDILVVPDRPSEGSDLGSFEQAFAGVFMSEVSGYIEQLEPSQAETVQQLLVELPEMVLQLKTSAKGIDMQEKIVLVKWELEEWFAQFMTAIEVPPDQKVIAHCIEALLAKTLEHLEDQETVDTELLNRLGTREYKLVEPSALIGALLQNARETIHPYRWLGKFTLLASIA